MESYSDITLVALKMIDGLTNMAESDHNLRNRPPTQPRHYYYITMFQVLRGVCPEKTLL